MQNRQQTLKIEKFVSFATCRDIRQSIFPSNNYNSSNKTYEHRDKNRNGFLRQIIKMVISSQIIQIVTIEEILIHKV